MRIVDGFKLSGKGGLEKVLQASLGFTEILGMCQFLKASRNTI